MSKDVAYTLIRNVDKHGAKHYIDFGKGKWPIPGWLYRTLKPKSRAGRS